MAAPRIAFADALRGLAALSVIFFHYAGVFWAWPDVAAAMVNAPAPILRQDVGLLTRIAEPHAWFSFGHFGVALFFLVSGFVIPAALSRHTRLGFALGRLIRLWPTYAVGLTCALLWLAVSSAHAARPFPYGPADVLWHYALGVRDLAGGASIDGIVWTLEVEVRFYLLCVLIAPLLTRRSGDGVAMAIGGVAAGTLLLDRAVGLGAAIGNGGVRVAAALAVSGQMIVYMLIGTLFHLRFVRAIGRAALGVLVAVAFALFALLWRGGSQASVAMAGVASYAVALGVFALTYHWRDVLRVPRVLLRVADVSYPLYVVHALPGYAVMTIAASRGLRAPFAVFLALAWAVVASVAVHLWIERPTHEAGRKVAARM